MVKYRPPEGVTRRPRRLRKEPTDAEQRMWRLLREAFPDAHFRRHVPIRHFIADFASHGLKLVIEVDGGRHDERTDAALTASIEAEGYRVVRFWNHDVLGNGDGVMMTLAPFVEAPPPRRPSPIKGEGDRRI